MEGKVCVVTGATGGIGGAAAAALVARGATVVLVARDPGRAEAMAAALRAREAGAVHTVIADLSSQRQVRRAAAEIGAAFPRVHVLVNNAGTFSWRRRRTEDGVELQWAVNHLAPYLLTRLLIPVLQASGGARVVNVASGAHRKGRIDARDPTAERRVYSGLGTYAATKLANILFTRELARRSDPLLLTAHALHPGVVATEILLGSFPPLRLMRNRMLTPEEGARTVVHLACSEEGAAQTGLYWQDNQPRDPAPQATDDLLAHALWDWSETAVGGVG